MKEGAKSVPEASYFLSSGCEPLRSGLGITGLLLPQVLASHMVNAVGSGSPAIDLGNEIIWDDHDADDRKLSAAAFVNTMSVMRVSAAACQRHSQLQQEARLEELWCCCPWFARQHCIQLPTIISDGKERAGSQQPPGQPAH